MSDLLIFIFFIVLFILPLSIFVNWYRYKKTIVFKTAFAILSASLLVAIISFMVGYYGIKNLWWYIPVGYLALFIGNLTSRKFVQRPIKNTTKVLDEIKAGDLSVNISQKNKHENDEIGIMNISFQEMVDNLRETAEFARQIGEGNLDHKIEPLSEQDELRIALIEMRDKLKKAAVLQEDQRKEEKKRQWANEGLAKVNEILRQQEDVDELAYNTISFIINYLGANQGGIFVREDEDNKIIFDLKACYAYDRRKFLNKTFEPGEGLLGTCALEKETIQLTEIPDNYIQISSGLGEANPKYIAMVPMKLEEEVLGIMEIASFDILEEYQIDFLEQVSLTIASSLNMTRTNKRTSELLEKTQQQAEEMSAQEEEMRQNMEELQATQEESSRKAADFEEQLDVITSELEEAENREEKLHFELKQAKTKIKKLEQQLKKQG